MTALARRSTATVARAGAPVDPFDKLRTGFIDETATTTKMTRRRGRARNGQRLKARVPFDHWKTQTFIAGLLRWPDRGVDHRQPKSAVAEPSATSCVDKCDGAMPAYLLPDPVTTATELIGEAIAGWQTWARGFGDFDDTEHPAQAALRALDRWRADQPTAR